MFAVALAGGVLFSLANRAVAYDMNVWVFAVIVGAAAFAIRIPALLIWGPRTSDIFSGVGMFHVSAAAIAGIAVACGDIAFYKLLHLRVPLSIVVPILFASKIALIALADSLIFGTRLTGLQVAGIAMALMSIACLTYARHG